LSFILNGMGLWIIKSCFFSLPCGGRRVSDKEERAQWGGEGLMWLGPAWRRDKDGEKRLHPLIGLDVGVVKA